MFLQQLWQRWLGRSATNARARSTSRPRARLMVEPLEDRAVPALYSAATVPELIGAITAANQSPEADTITLAPGKSFTLTAVNNTDDGPTGLPVIAADGGNLTIVGNGDVIERSKARKTPVFRLLVVQAGASLTLQNLTLQGGYGAIYNLGTLTMSGVTVQNNTGGGIGNLGKLTMSGGIVQNNTGGGISNLGTLTMSGVTVQKNAADGAGGIYSNGSLTLQDCIIRDNQARGHDGSPGVKGTDDFTGFPFYDPPTAGGWGLGGGLYIAGGTANLLSTTVTHNTAQGGQGGQGRYGYPDAPDGFGQGGGMYIESDAVVVLDAFTAAHVIDNSADVDPDIYGTFSIS